MKLKPSALRELEETCSYPALLARLAGQRDGDPAALLLDVLDAPAADEPGATAKFRRYLEDMELAAAEFLGESRDIPDWQPLLFRARAQARQVIEGKIRDARSLELGLRDTGTAYDEIAAKVEQLVADERLQAARPRQFLDRLESLISQMEALARSLEAELRRDTAALRAETRPATQRDVDLALRRLEANLSTPEHIPRALRFREIARRANEGRLTPEDIRELNREPTGQGRLVRLRSAFPDDLRTAADILPRLQKDAGELSVPEAATQEVVTLFRGLMPQAGGSLKPKEAAHAILRFLGAPLSPQAGNSSRGAWHALRLPQPRVPALRSHPPPHLLVPIRVDDASIPLLLRDGPAHGIRIVYYPGRADRGIRMSAQPSGDAAWIDNIDLMRLAEASPEQRSHAFQQVILPRLSVAHVRPYQLGGPVEPEMFRGRRDVVDRLRQPNGPNGPTVLFSGRMMGKSSVLKRVHALIQEEAGGFRAQGRAPRAESIFLSNAAEDLLTPLIDRLAKLLPPDRVQDILRREKAIPAQLRPKERRELRTQRLGNVKRLVGMLLESDRQLTILIDEADQFAASDAELPRAESLAWTLRDLEQERPQQLRVVFAGFQTIHRHVLFHNGAFANWFGLQPLGPLDAADGRSLVEEPFADLGFVFSSPSAVDRILEFTASHPLLLQETCAHLMDRMASRRTGDEVVEVHAADVETVCRDANLRDRVRRVLTLNLDKDPRLKLMVYLILAASVGRGTRSQIPLESFELEKLKSALAEFYGSRFGEFFDERSIGALVKELISLGLLRDAAGRYEFSNRTFASMLLQERGFESELESLLVRVTVEEDEAKRIVPTLTREDSLRVFEQQGPSVALVGLPGTQQEVPSRFDAVDAGGCRTRQDFTARVRRKLNEPASVSMIDALVRHQIQTLEVRSADSLAEGGVLDAIMADLSERNVRLVLLGSAPLGRACIASLAAGGSEKLEIIPLRRLRPQDVRARGEREAQDQAHVTFDDTMSARLVEVTGGHLSLVQHFEEFLRRGNKARELIPSPQDLERFVGELTCEIVESVLLSSLEPAERAFLVQIIETASANQWELDWEAIDDFVLGPLMEKRGDSKVQWLDRFEVLRALDLLEERSAGGARTVFVPAGELLRRALPPVAS